MRVASLAGSLGYAFVAGLAAVAWTLFATPWLGRPMALAMFVTVSITFYLLSIAPTWRRGVRAAALCAGVSVLTWIALPIPGVMLLASAAALAVGRSGLLHRSRPARALVTEVALLAFGLAFARGLYGGGALDVGLAVWGFFLLQSTFFLLGDQRHAQPSAVPGDPFERAQAKMEEVLERA